jgi:hypothetical protein
MTLPFSATQFFDLFVAYHRTFGAAVFVLWIASLGLVVQLARGRARSTTVNVIAALHWGWSGIAYHALFFTRINRAAWLFAVLFVAQAVAFLWYGVARRRLTYVWNRTPRRVLGAAFLVYALAYPGLVFLSGHTFPRAPAFAVPCPTTIFTAGLLLLTASRLPLALFVVPILWSAVGGSAARLFGVTPDLMLFVAGVCLAVFAVRSRRATDSPSVGDTRSMRAA